MQESFVMFYPEHAIEDLKKNLKDMKSAHRKQKLKYMSYVCGVFITLLSFTLQCLAGCVWSQDEEEHALLPRQHIQDNELDQQIQENELEASKQLISITEGTYRHMARWSYLSSFVNRGLYWSFLRESQELSSEDILSSSRLWIYGESTLLKTERARQKVYGLDAFLEGNVTVLMEGVDLAFKILLATQIFYSISEHQSFGNIFELVFNGDDNSIRGIYHVGKEVPNAQYFWFIFTLPTCWGLFKGYQAFHQGALLHLEESLEALRSSSSSIYRDFLRWFLPFNEIEEHLASLTRDLLWNGSFSEEDRIKSFQTLVGFLNAHGGRSRNAALYNLFRIANGNSMRNGKAIDPEIREGILNRKAQALSLLEEESTDLKHKIFGKQIFWKGLPALYSRYLLWSLGQCQDLKESFIWTAAYLGKSALIVLLLKTVIQGILDIMNCPQQPGFTWTGPAKWASDYTPECFRAYMKEFNFVPGQPVDTLLKMFSLFHLRGSISLDLSGKGINGSIIGDIVRGFIKNFPDVIIEGLDVSNNNFDSQSSISSEEVASLFSLLPKLGLLNISHNQIGLLDSNGTIAIGEALKSLPSLTTLDVSHNYIGFKDSKGTVVLGEGLKSLLHLTTLDASHNWIGFTGSAGIAALGKAFRNVTHLTTLDLSHNQMGLTDSKGTVVLGEALGNLTRLTTLDLSHNYIDSTDSNGSTAIGESLSNLTALTTLKMSGNFIDFTNSTLALQVLRAILLLRHLTNFYIMQLEEIPAGFVSSLQSLWNHRQGKTDLYTFQNASMLENYLGSLPSNTTLLNLSGQFGNAVVDFIAPLVSFFPKFFQLTILDLSDNYIGRWDSNTTVALGKGLKFVPHLTTFNLSHNYIDLLDSAGTVAIGEGLKSLPGLINLDLSNNLIGLWNSAGTVAIGEGLKFLPSLIALDLSNNWIGFQNSSGAVAIGAALANLSHLNNLDLSDNYIGFQDSDGSISIGESFGNLTRLITLDVSGNFIGRNGPEGSLAILDSLPTLLQGSLQNVNLGGMTNVTWTTGEKDLESFIDRTLKKSCATQRCFGGTMTTDSISQNTNTLVNPGDEEFFDAQETQNNFAHITEDEEFFDTFPDRVTSAASMPLPPHKQLLQYVQSHLPDEFYPTLQKIASSLPSLVSTYVVSTFVPKMLERGFQVLSLSSTQPIYETLGVDF